MSPIYNYQRSILLDAFKGVGMIIMIIFHFCFDLNYFKYASIQLFSDTFWLAFRYVAISIFMSAVGISLVLHSQRGISWSAYLRRLILLAFCALSITCITYFIYPRSYVFFGILHLIAVSSVFALIFIRLSWINIILGLAVIYAGFVYSHPIFNTDYLYWLGMYTSKRSSVDFAPLFPWFGCTLIGMGCANYLQDKMYILSSMSSATYIGQILHGLAFMGRKSLFIYLWHQPILWILFYVTVLLGRYV